MNEQALERALLVALAIFGAYHLLTGGLALIAPDTFFDDIGRYGVENSHYVGDVGAFTAAYGIALLAAIRFPSWRVPILALGAVWYGLHAINHLFDVDEARSDARGWFDTIALAFGAAFSAWLAGVARRLERTAGEAS
jgi:hypothetical protein